ncbi:hypothetical protein A9Q86_10030 [Flavobacteriales bacterium 33_180_T64]|nr:hypothetical protein A9Q86_10030 [Flavobacteriales bacterium 33_180_T64]
MKQIYILGLALILNISHLIAQTTIDFDSESFVETADYGSNTYVSGNFRLIFSSGNFFEDTDNGESSSNGLSLLFFIANETLTIETIDQSEFKFESFYLTNFFGNGASIEGFKDNISVASQTNGFPISDSNGVVSLDTNFENIDRAIITFSGGAFDVVDSFVFNPPTLDIPEFTSVKSNLKIFPNPSVDYIQIKGLTNQLSYRILDITGNQLSFSSIKDDNKIDIKSLANGIYFIRFDNGITSKFIKK